MVGTKGPQAPGTGVSCVSPFLFPGPACLQATASPPSSHPSVTDPLKARVLASGVGYTRLWRPKPAFPHPEWSLSRTVSFAHTRWGGFGGLGETLSLVHENQPPWSCQGEHHRLRDTKYVSQGPPRAVSELPPPRTQHKQTPETLDWNRVNYLWINSSCYKTKTYLWNISSLKYDTEKNKMYPHYVLITDPSSNSDIIFISTWSKYQPWNSETLEGKKKARKSMAFSTKFTRYLFSKYLLILY